MDDATKQYLDLMKDSIHEKVDTVKTDITAELTELKDDQKDGFKLMNGRVRKLENWRNWTVGGMSFTSVGIGLYTKLRGLW